MNLKKKIEKLWIVNKTIELLDRAFAYDDLPHELVTFLTSWIPRKTHYHLYGGDLYTALENIIKGKVEETIIRP